MYDNFNAINVNKVADIPCDYGGVMGVPITFMDKFNPDQFEIIGLCSGVNDSKLLGIPITWEKSSAHPYVNGKKAYARIFIRKKQFQ